MLVYVNMCIRTFTYSSKYKLLADEREITYQISVSYQLDDVIGCEDAVKGWFQKTEITRVWLIEHGSSNVLLKKCKVISGDQRKRFHYDLTEMLTKGLSFTCTLSSQI